MLHEKSRFQFTIEAITGLDEAVTRLARHDIDVVLLDLSLVTHQAETDAVHLILESQPQLALLVLTELENEHAGLRALEAGAQDYLLKEEIGAHILVRALYYAVERARFEQGLHESEAKLEIELADTQQLQRISSSLIKEDDIDALYGQILDAARALTRSDMASIQMLMPERNELFLLAQRGFAPESAQHWEWVKADDTSACGLVLRNAKPIIVPDVELWDFVAGTKDLDHYHLSGIRAVLSMPLTTRDARLVGAISTHWHAVHQPSERELRLLDVLARQAADLIERRLTENVLRQSEEKYRTLFNSIDEGFVIVELKFDPNGNPIDGLVLETNPSFDRLIQVSNVIGKTARQIFPDVEQEWFEIYKQVLVTGEAIRFERYLGPLKSWFEVYVSRVNGGSSNRIVMVFTDITERKRSELLLRKSEEQQAFLLKLSDALRPLNDAVEMKAAANRILGEYLRTDRTYYVELDRARGLAVLERDYVRGDEPSLAGAHPIAAFEATLANHRTGRPTVCDDALIDPRITDADRPAYLNRRLRSFVTTPLIKNGEFMGAMSVTNREPRAWQPDEVALVVDVAERTWDAVQRARAEAAEREHRLMAEGLRDTAIVLSQTLKMDETLEAALAAARHMIPFEAGFIILTENGKVKQFQANGLKTKQNGFLERWYHNQANTDATAPYQLATDSRKPVLLQKAQLRSMRLPAAFGHMVLVVPLLHEDHAIGYLTLTNWETPELSENDFLKLQALAYQMVIAIQSAKRFQQAQELVVLKERNQIARDLHDAVTQTLFSASIISGALAKQTNNQYSENMQKTLASVHRLIQGALAEMRALLLELRPTHVYNTTFTQLLQQIAQAALGRKEIDIELTVEGEPGLPPEVHLALYRVVQEAVNNILKHAQASQVSISGRGGAGYIDLWIRDNGHGFDADETSSGMGLSNMRERTAEVHAHLTVHSVVGDGTEIHIVWPNPDDGKTT